MTLYDANRHHRRSIRLPGYDYTQPGAYFITICAQDRGNPFGDVMDGIMRLNARGEIVDGCWREIPRHFPNVQLDAFVIMPNHMHGIIVLVGARHAVPLPSRHAVPLPSPHTVPLPQVERFGKPVAGSIPTIVRSFKSATTRRINEICHNPGAPLWQRNYYEHIIRNERALQRIREYILNNPLRWDLDIENPARRQGKAINMDRYYQSLCEEKR